jgi:mannose-6-phosphate isomerase-like protein (cupin superfamily)
MSKARALLSTAFLGCLIAGAARAGSCPADKVLQTPRQIEDVTNASKLTAEVVKTVDPSGWRSMKGLMLRTRRLTVLPGGFVPTHSHEDRPAIIYIISGQVIENSSEGSVPVEMMNDRIMQMP